MQVFHKIKILIFILLVLFESLVNGMSCHDVLGVKRNATDADIKKAFCALSLKYHPDKNGNDKASVQIFQYIKEAYDILKDTNKKTKYSVMAAPPNCRLCHKNYKAADLKGYDQFCCGDAAILCDFCAQRHHCSVHNKTFSKGVPYCYVCNRAPSRDHKINATCCAIAKSDGIRICDGCAKRPSIRCLHCHGDIIFDKKTYFQNQQIAACAVFAGIGLFSGIRRTLNKCALRKKLDRVRMHARSLTDQSKGRYPSQYGSIASAIDIELLFDSVSNANIDIADLETAIGEFDRAVAGTGRTQDIRQVLHTLEETIEQYKNKIGSPIWGVFGSVATVLIGAAGCLLINKYHCLEEIL